MHNAPLTGARIPDLTDNTNLAQWFSEAVNDLDDNSVPRFTTAAARDTAYSNWVGAGNTMSDGLVSAVAGRLQVYRASQWRGVGSLFYNTTSVNVWSVAVTDDNVRTIASIAIPDPGWTYRVRVAGAFTATAVGGRVDSVITIGADNWDVCCGNPGGFSQHRHSSLSPNTYTGTQSLIMNAYRVPGSGGSWTNDGGSTFFFQCELVPA